MNRKYESSYRSNIVHGCGCTAKQFFEARIHRLNQSVESWRLKADGTVDALVFRLARAWCDECGHDYFIAYSCKGHGVCALCNTRRMVEKAAHPSDHVFACLPMRQPCGH